MNKVNKKGETALYIACKEGHEAVVEMLLDANADINKANKRGQTPLFIASRYGQIEVVKILLMNNVCFYFKRNDLWIYYSLYSVYLGCYRCGES